MLYNQLCISLRFSTVLLQFGYSNQQQTRLKQTKNNYECSYCESQSNSDGVF